MGFRTICVALVLSSLPIAGCGTIKNTVVTRPEEGGKTPFGGVRHDMVCIRQAANGEYGRTGPKSESEQHPQVFRTLLFAADLSFTYIGDFMTWPYTAAYTYINEPIPTPPVTLTTPPANQPGTMPPATLTMPMPIPAPPPTLPPTTPPATLPIPPLPGTPAPPGSQPKTSP